MTAPAAQSENALEPRPIARRPCRYGTGRLSFTSEDTMEWSRLRRVMFTAVESQYCDWFIGAIIVFNIFVIVFETNATGECRSTGAECAVPWIDSANSALLAIYTMEAATRLFVYRYHIKTKPWDIFDVAIVLLSYLDVVLNELFSGGFPGIEILRIFRVAKILRAARVVRVFPELATMLKGFISAMSAMLWGLMMIMVLSLIWAVLGVEFLQPVSLEVFGADHACSESFSGVMHNMLFLFQTLVAGTGLGRRVT
eukprot:TRINITY_DN10575_c0_g1_i2.p1 TRINITY_DN10575_c0_g1~~TRINITY_DN10575_c0_g1_i2.p1  ORF type:complete len:300 (-),score=21.86 TRINITY_DN10575_c0_g1_i2:53-817(-)